VARGERVQRRQESRTKELRDRLAAANTPEEKAAISAQLNELDTARQEGVTRGQPLTTGGDGEALLPPDRPINPDEKARATEQALRDLIPRQAQEDPAVAQKIADDAMSELLRTVPGPDGGGEDGPPPEVSKKDLRSRYKEQIKLYKELFGEDDEDRARDKAMSLAMLGLAIAAGQSPDFLTNVTQGTMAGLQGMSEQEQARRERDRGLQTLALETAIGEQSAEAEAAARAAEAEYDRETRFEVERIKAQGGSGSTYTPERLRQLVTNNITSNPGEYPALLTEDGSLDPSRLNRFVQDVVKGVGATRPLKTTGFDAAEQATVDAAKERLAQYPANRSKIAQRLSDVGIDPGVLGDG